MRYCPKCDSEYRDDVALCTDDGERLLDKAAYDAAIKRSGNAPSRLGRLTAVLSLGDRFQAEELARALVEEGLNVALVSTKTAMLGTITSPGPEVFSLVVPDGEADQARQLLAEWRPELEAGRAAAELAAEEEEAKTEPHSTR